MTIEDLLISIGVGVIATLVASALIWVFRRQLREAFAALDMSTGAILAWVMAFIMLAVVIVFPLIGVDTPAGMLGLLAVIIGFLIVSTVWRRH